MNFVSIQNVFVEYTTMKNGIMEEKKILIYDVRSIPEGMTLEHILSVFEETRVIIYDSLSTGNLPFTVDVHNVDETEIVRLNVEKVNETNVQTFPSA